MEDITHVLRDCHVAKSFWTEAEIPANDPEFYSSPCNRWLKSNAINSSTIPNKPFTWDTFFLFGIWNLWLQRNRCNFQHSNHKPSLLDDVETLASEFSCLVIPLRSVLETHLIQVKWKLPSHGWFKLNTDGSALGCPGLAGGGGLIRDDHGKWAKGFLRKISKVSSLEAKLWAIRDGLILCNQLLIQELLIKLDAKAVISLLTCKTESFAQYAPLIDDCRNLLHQHPDLALLQGI